LDLITVEDWEEEKFAEGEGLKWKKWDSPTPQPASALTLYRSSIQLQSKMATPKTWFIEHSIPK